MHCLARDAGISQATGYRYLHEGINILAAQAPDLHEVLERYRQEGKNHVILDGTLIQTDRPAGTAPSVKGTQIDAWYSGKHKCFGGNVQFLASADGTPLWTSDVEPGSTHDLTAELKQRRRATETHHPSASAGSATSHAPPSSSPVTGRHPATQSQEPVLGLCGKGG